MDAPLPRTGDDFAAIEVDRDDPQGVDDDRCWRGRVKGEGMKSETEGVTGDLRPSPLFTSKPGNPDKSMRNYDMLIACWSVVVPRESSGFLDSSVYVTEYMTNCMEGGGAGGAVTSGCVSGTITLREVS